MRTLYPISQDGTGDDWPQIKAAIQASAGSTVVVMPGTYNVRSAPLSFTGIHGLRVVGEGQPKIRYRSAHATPGQPTIDRAAVYAVDCQDLTFDGIQWEGDNEPDLTLNVGPVFYLRGCTRPILANQRLTFGGSLFQQDPTITDRGLLVTNCHSYSHRQPCIPGPYSRIEKSSWELPFDPSWDRFGSMGSSHGIYLFAGRDHVTVEDCAFTGIRTHALKASGTVSPITHLRARGNRFIECGGGVLFGADGASDANHSDALIEDNLFIDCANRAAGWFMGAAITVLGAMGSTVRGNKLVYSRTSVTPAACKGIEAQRYYTGSAGGRLCEDIVIADNEILARVSGVNPGNILTHGIYLYEVARARVERNHVQASAGVGVTVAQGCTLAKVTDLRVTNVVSAVQVFSAAGVEVKSTRIVRGPYTSTNPQIRFAGCSGIESGDNSEMGTAGMVPAQELVT